MVNINVTNLNKRVKALNLAGESRILKAIKAFLLTIEPGNRVRISGLEKNKIILLNAEGVDKETNKVNCWNGLITHIIKPNFKSKISNYYFILDCGIRVQLPSSRDVQTIIVGYQMSVIPWIKRPEFYIINIYSSSQLIVSYLLAKELVKNI